MRIGHPRAFAPGIALSAALLLAPPAPAAHAGWLQKGLDLFRGGATEEAAPLTSEEIAGGLRDALRVGTARVVETLGTRDGFYEDAKVRIPLPGGLQKARKTLEPMGMAGPFDDLELKLNRAAEDAVPEAKALFWSAIEQMTLEDVQTIYAGPEDAATRYFQDRMSAPLREKMRPVVATSLGKVGALQSYDTMVGKYRHLPFVPDLKADLTRHVLDGALDGMFFYLAREEAAIREDPARRTTELLQRVFGR